MLKHWHFSPKVDIGNDHRISGIAPGFKVLHSDDGENWTEANVGDEAKAHFRVVPREVHSDERLRRD